MGKMTYKPMNKISGRSENSWIYSRLSISAFAASPPARTVDLRADNTRKKTNPSINLIKARGREKKREREREQRIMIFRVAVFTRIIDSNKKPRAHAVTYARRLCARVGNNSPSIFNETYVIIRVTESLLRVFRISLYLIFLRRIYSAECVHLSRFRPPLPSSLKPPLLAHRRVIYYSSFFISLSAMQMEQRTFLSSATCAKRDVSHTARSRHHLPFSLFLSRSLAHRVV